MLHSHHIHADQAECWMTHVESGWRSVGRVECHTSIFRLSVVVVQEQTDEGPRRVHI